MHRINAKKNSEFSIGYVQRILAFSLGTVNKISVLKENWESIVKSFTRQSTLELTLPKAISEETILNLLRK